MAILIQANEAVAARRRIYFHCVDETDAKTPEVGEAGGQPQFSSNGAAWTAVNLGVLVAIGNGRYYAQLAQAAVVSEGTIIESRYKSGNTTETIGSIAQVVGFDPAAPVAAGGGEGGIELGATIEQIETTHLLTTGGISDADALPTAVVYEQGTALGYAPTLTDVGVGRYEIAMTCSAANGFEIGKNYDLYMNYTMGAIDRERPVMKFVMLASGTSGPYTFTVTCQEADADKIQGCVVKVTAQGAATGVTAETNALGIALFYLQGELASPITYDIVVTPPTGYVVPAAETQAIGGADAAKTITVAESGTLTGTSVEAGKEVTFEKMSYSPDDWYQYNRKPDVHFQFKQDGAALNCTGYTAAVRCYRQQVPGTLVEDGTALVAHTIALGIFAFSLDADWDTLTPGTYIFRGELTKVATPTDRYYPADEVPFEVKLHRGAAP